MIVEADQAAGIITRATGAGVLTPAARTICEVTRTEEILLTVISQGAIQTHVNIHLDLASLDNPAQASRACVYLLAAASCPDPAMTPEDCAGGGLLRIMPAAGFSMRNWRTMAALTAEEHSSQSCAARLKAPCRRFVSAHRRLNSVALSRPSCACEQRGCRDAVNLGSQTTQSSTSVHTSLQYLLALKELGGQSTTRDIHTGPPFRRSSRAFHGFLPCQRRSAGSSRQQAPWATGRLRTRGRASHAGRPRRPSQTQPSIPGEDGVPC